MRMRRMTLDDTLKQKIAGLDACYSCFHSQGRIGHQVPVGAGYEFFAGEPPLYPIVKLHPVTKRPSLCIGRHAAIIPSMKGAEAEALLAELMDFMCRPRRVYEHSWQPGDVAVWDTRYVLHRARPIITVKSVY